MTAVFASAKAWGGTATATITVKQNGLVTGTGGSAVEWFLPSGGTPGTGRYVRATKVGDMFTPSGTFNTWQQINADRAWALAAPSGTYCESSVKLEFSDSSSGSPISGTLIAYFDADAINDTGGGGGYIEP